MPLMQRKIAGAKLLNFEFLLLNLKRIFAPQLTKVYTL